MMRRMKKKILLIGNCYYVIFRFRKELIRRCVDEGFEVWTAFPNGSHGEKELGSDTAERMGCHFAEIKMRRRSFHPGGELQVYLALKKLIEQIRPDLILTFTIKPNLYGGMLARKCKIPYLMNITGLGSALGKNGLLPRLLRSLTIRNMEHASCVFFQNIHDRNYFLRHGYTGRNVQMLPGSGVNLEEYKRLPYPDDSLIRFLYIARVMREKGIEEFLELAKYYADREDVEFHICGDCEEDYLNILKKMQQEKIIVYHGQVSEVKKYMAMAHCVVLPTFYHEGVPNTLLEAMACARPVITTDHPGCRETVEDGASGYLCKIQDSAQLIHKVEQFLSLSGERKESMGLNGRRKAEQEFDRTIVVSAYMKGIKNLISK